jgi:hypothetical protein
MQTACAFITMWALYRIAPDAMQNLLLVCIAFPMIGADSLKGAYDFLVSASHS